MNLQVQSIRTGGYGIVKAVVKDLDTGGFLAYVHQNKEWKDTTGELVTNTQVLRLLNSIKLPVRAQGKGYNS